MERFKEQGNATDDKNGGERELSRKEKPFLQVRMAVPACFASGRYILTVSILVRVRVPLYGQPYRV